MKTINFLEKEVELQEKKEMEYLKYQQILENIEKVKVDLNNFLQVDLEEMVSYLPTTLSEDEWIQLNWIKVLLMGNQEKQLDFQLVPEQKDLLMKFIDKVEIVLKEKLESRKEENTSTKEVLEKLKIGNREVLQKLDLECLFETIETSNLSVEEQLELLVEILRWNRESFYYQMGEEKSKETNLDEESVKKIFSAYSLDYDQIADFKDVILKYGNLDKIATILECLDNNQLLGRIDYTSQSFVHILTFSSQSLVQKQIDFSKKYHVDFNDLLGYPSNFISNDRLQKKNQSHPHIMRSSDMKPRTEKNNIRKNKHQNIGTAEDFELNEKYLQELDLDINRIIKNNASLLSTKHFWLRKNIESILLYRFDIHSDKFSFSAFRSGEIVPLVDSFIELGLYEYLKENPSNLSFYTNRMLRNIFYQNKNNMEVLNNRGLIGSLRTSTIAPIHEKDRIINLEEKYQQFGDTLPSYYDCVRNASNLEIRNMNSNSLLSCLEQFTLEGNNLIYKVNGIFISRLKVLRIYQQVLKHPELDPVNGLLFAITYNSLLSDEDFESLRKSVLEWNNYIQEEEKQNGISKKI